MYPKTSASFRALFKGVVVDAGDVDAPVNGSTKGSFALVDGNGIWLLCVALRSHAEMHTFEKA